MDAYREIEQDMTRGPRGSALVALAIVLLAASPLGAQHAAVPDILVSRQLADAERLSVGDVVGLATASDGTQAVQFRIAGIYEPTPDPSRLGTVPRQVRLHLPDLVALTRPPDAAAGSEYVSTINVALADPADGASFARDVANRMPGVTARRSAEAEDAAAFLVLERFHLAIAIVTIVAATVFLLALTIMLVDERRETVGVLRLIGLPARRILLQIFLEGALIASAGSLFGLLLAVASQAFINRFFQWRYDTALIFVRITPEVAALCLAIAVPLGAIATVAASWTLLRRNALRLARR
jgi:putative ABC transport system permease protein